MFWIMGADAVSHNIAKVPNLPFWNSFSMQMHHPDWNGFLFFDMIFPLFLFLACVATTPNIL